MNEEEDSLTPPPPHPPITSEEEDPTPILEGMAPQEVVGGTSKRRVLTPSRKGWWSTFYRKVKSLRILCYFVFSVTDIKIYLFIVKIATYSPTYLSQTIIYSNILLYYYCIIIMILLLYILLS